jgi:3-dehydroquinate dehydratase/shikimate dehydrogenase
MNLIEPRPYPRISPTAAVALVATLDEKARAKCDLPRTMPKSVSWMQVRADLVGDISPEWLRAEFGGGLLYTLGNQSVGEERAPGPPRRERLIAAAAEGYDLIELDADTDTDAGVLDAIPPERRLISWRGTAASAPELARRFRQIAITGARFYLLTVQAGDVASALVPLHFLRSVGRKDVTAYADGELGLFSRVLAPYLGAPLLFGGRPGGGWNPSGSPRLERMILDFGLPALPAVDRVFGIAGAAAAQSLSPSLHNAVYRALGYPALYLPFQVNSFAEFWRGFVERRGLEELGWPVRGLTVASPNKEAATRGVAIRSRASRCTASANLLFRHGRAWAAATTDPIGVLTHLDRRTIPGQRAAVIGCGGSGRAIAWALDQAGAKVTLVNRCRERGEQASRLLDLPFDSLARFSAEGYDLIINATPVGSHGDALPISIRGIPRHAIVVDLVYAQAATPLADSARARGIRVVDGCEVLRAQVEKQFTRMTGLAPPPGLVADRLGLAPSPSAR